MSKKNDDFFNEKKPWSKIKDELLSYYLVPYFSKIFATKKPIFYVDAFAGTGKFKDGNLGSPLIALNIIEDRLMKTQFLHPLVETCFIEKKYYKELRENLANYPKARLVNGKYEDNINKLLEDKKNYNVFMYIDPFGIKSLHFSVFDRLKERQLNSIEILMNMNSFGFIREACNALNAKFDIEDLDEIIENWDEDLKQPKSKSISDLNSVAGGEYWQKIISDYSNGYIDGYEAEKLFAVKYCEKLKTVFKYVLNIPIRLKKGQRPKYRMIYATNHVDGCILMNDDMCERWQVLENTQNGGQMSLFDQNVENDVINKDELRECLCSRINEVKSYMRLNEFLAKLFMDLGICYKTSDIIQQMKVLEKENKLIVKRTPEKTDKGRKSTFWTDKTTKKLEIRCKI